MPADNGIYVLDRFLGLNRSSYRWNMSPEWVWDLVNGYIEASPDGRGAIQQRYGVSKYNATTIGASTKVRALYEAIFDDGTTAVIARAGTAWYRYNAGDFTSLDGSRTSDAQGVAVMFENELMMVDGGVPRKSTAAWSVSAISADANMPQDATTAHVHQHRLWLNSAANPMKVYGCDEDDATGATAWSGTGATGSLTLDLSQVLPKPDTVLAYRSIGDLMFVIFCKDHIVIYDIGTDVTAAQLVQVINVGAISQYAIAQVGQDWVYPALSGAKSLISSEASQKLDTNDLSANIEPLYREYVGVESDVTDICGTYYHLLNHYYITFHRSGSDMARTLAFSPELKNFVGVFEFHVDPYSWLETQAGVLYMGGDDGFVYKVHDSTTNLDDTSQVNFLYEPPALGVASLNRYKALRQMEALIESNQTTTLQFEYSYGLDSAGLETLSQTFEIVNSKWNTAKWNTAKWGGQGRKLITEYGFLGRGRSINIKLRNETNSSRVKIPYLIVRAIMEGEK